VRTGSLSVKGLRMTVLGRVLFHDLSFELPSTGLICLMGPMGSGKSTLLEWICGLEDRSVVATRIGSALLAGAPLDDGNRPSLLAQHTIGTGTEAITRLTQFLATEASIVCIDEPTAGLAPDEAAKVLDLLAKASRQRTVLMVTHNQLQAASFADEVMLIAGGTLQEITPAKLFFTAPASEAGRQFIGTGGVSIIPIHQDRRLLNPALREVPTRLSLLRERNGFDPELSWIVRDKIAFYTPTAAERFSTQALRVLTDKGVTALVLFDAVNAEEKAAIAASGLSSVQLRVDLAKPASVHGCRQLCQEFDRLLALGHRIAVAPASRGDMAARTVGAQLVRMGVPAGIAADALRRIVRADELSLEDEQLLWDLELAFDLEATEAALDRHDFAGLRQVADSNANTDKAPRLPRGARLS
jgi:ABC-type phosphate transport system ATPase subunit